MVAKKSSDLTQNMSSLRLWIFIVVCAYLGLTLYWVYTALTWGTQTLMDPYVHEVLSKGPWWWMFLFYSSEALAGMVSFPLRAIAGLFALYSAVLFWMKKESALPLIKGKVGTALLLEGIFILSFILSVVAAFIYNLSTENLWYFDGTPKLTLLFVTGIPCLAMITVIPPVIFKLRSKIIHGSPSQDIIKWSCLTGVAYLFVVFWFNYSMAWVATMIPYWPYYRAPMPYGASFLLEPVNFAAFLLTVVGLLLIAIFALMSTLPAIKKLPVKLSLKRIGATIAAFGSYFILVLFLYFLHGGFEANPTPWYEIIGPLHNPDLWCIAFLFLGVAVFLAGRKTKRSE
jgi:hypothetical protein